MKKAILIPIILISILLIATGCTKQKSVTYDVSTGDKIKLTLDTSDGYDISAKTPFKITKDNETISQGTFVTLDGYDDYIQKVSKNNSANIIEQSSKNGVEYTFYSCKNFNHMEYNYIIKISGSKTGVILGNMISEESARDCFNRLKFSEGK